MACACVPEVYTADDRDDYQEWWALTECMHLCCYGCAVHYAVHCPPYCPTCAKNEGIEGLTDR